MLRKKEKERKKERYLYNHVPAIVKSPLNSEVVAVDIEYNLLALSPVL